MSKETKRELNQVITGMWNECCEEHRYTPIEVMNPKRLRYCSAFVYETKNFYILRSYATFVAFIDKRTNYGYDVLRLEYGYTATSAQHISKFFHDYGKAKWGCEFMFRYYPI